MAVISGSNMCDILRKSFSILNPNLMHHSERTAYILYKMLLTEGKMTKREMADYVIIGMLHDIGTCKLEYIDPGRILRRRMCGHIRYSAFFSLNICHRLRTRRRLCFITTLITISII